MRLRSTVSLLIFFTVCALIINLLVGLFKQIISQKKINFYLEQKKAELAKLQEENEKLKKSLEETEKPDFLNKEAGRLFGLTRDGQLPEEKIKREEPQSENTPPKIPNWQKWLKLFGF